jgi:menaquinone-9 beta-reductase
MRDVVHTFFCREAKSIFTAKFCVQKPITIVGGGIAGLTLGIGLRQRGVPVTIFEAGKYPRHRVCGEFISGSGERVIERLNLRKLFVEAGSVSARTARFFSKQTPAPVRSLPVPALCLSRFKMDALLAETFRKLGGVLRDGERYRSESVTQIVRASGRRIDSTENSSKWFGLKAHVRGVELSADLEMHLTRNGYVGLCKLRDGIVNVCGLFWRNQNQNEAHGFELLRGEQGSFLRQRLEHAAFDESSFCAVAGLSLKPQRASVQRECHIGDAISMIAPMTGNGMSMAFESAELAIEPLAAFSRGDVSWETARKTIASRCDALFPARLRRAILLQQCLMSSSVCTRLFMAVLGRSETFWRMAFRLTR